MMRTNRLAKTTVPPTSLPRVLRRTAPLVAAVSLALASPAWAACDEVAASGGTSFLCKNGAGAVNFPPMVRDAGALSVNTDATATDLSVTAASLAFQDLGLFVDGLNSGFIKVDVGDDFIGSGTKTVGAGVQVRSFNGSDVSIRTRGVVSSYATGISAQGGKSGNVDIVADGKVTGVSNWAINATNQAGGKDINITATDAESSGGAVIQAINSGTGSTAIRSSGTVTAHGRNGISASGSATTTGDINVEAHNVTGATANGIYVTNSGTGNVRVAVSGHVDGGENAIWVYNSAQGGYNTLALNTGADIVGNVVFNGGKGNILELNGNGTLTKTLAGFNQYSAAANSQWALNDAITTGQGDLRVTSAENANLTFGGAISGAGGLIKDGVGTFTLSGANSFAGSTQLQGGTLSLGNNTALSTGAVTMANGTGLTLADGLAIGNAITLTDGEGRFIVNDSGTASVTGTISGAGVLVKDGAGTLLLSPNNTYSGGTYVSLGFLGIDTSGALGTGALTVAGGGLALGNGTTISNNITLSGKADLRVADNGTATLSGVISDGSTAGDATKSGAGTLILTGANTYTGATTVAAGTLQVDGALRGSTTVADAARLTGTGTLGNVIIEKGGIFAPGHSPGTINVNGDVVFQAGSTYQVEILGNGVSDQINATGKATINDALMQVTALDPKTSYRDGQSYSVLTAAGGVTGQFATPTTGSDFLTLKLRYTDTAAILDIGIVGANPGGGTDPGEETPTEPTNPVVFQTAAITRNQHNVATALDSLPQAGDALALYNSLLVTDAATARRAFDQLSGEIHAGARTAMLDDRFLREGIVRQLENNSAREVGSWTPWVGAAGRSSRIDNDDNGAKLNATGQGLLAGIQWQAGEGFSLGLAAGWEDLSVQQKSLSAKADIDAWHAGLYAAKQWEHLWIRGGATYTSYDLDTRRDGVVDQARASYDADATSVFAESGWDFDLDKTVLTPYVAVAHTRLHTDGTNEAGGITRLDVTKSKDELLTATAGLRASWDISAGGKDGARLLANLAWQNASGELKAGSRQQFAVGGDQFIAYGTPLARNSAIAEIGIGVQTSANSRLSMSANGRSGDGQHEFGANLTWSVDL